MGVVTRVGLRQLDEVVPVTQQPGLEAAVEQRLSVKQQMQKHLSGSA